MSSIDQRIVEMQFKNSEFEKGVKESLKSLDKLKSGLDLSDSTKSIKDLQKAGDSFTLTKMADSIESVSNRFTMLGRIGVQVMDRISNSIINTGERLVKSLTVDQISTGWIKYGQKTASVQTIMNATGKTINEVNGYLDKLMWFSDETSYNFTEMTSALGTMTSSGGKIEKLIPMIEGMAAATAFAGKGASEFSRVIYNLNQSYGQGYLSYMDWKSVELANIGSEQLKQTIIDTAVAVGTLKKSADGAIKTTKGTLVTVANMGSTLNEKWANTDVMEQAFGKFGELFEEAYQLVESGQYDTAADAIASLAGKYDDVYFKAAKAAQEAKTFTEALEATKDAVSSGWMKTFEIIFGNYEEAKAMWTDLANALYEVFASGSEDRNALLQEWHDLGGRADLIQGISDALSGLWGIIIAIKDAFSDIFPPVTVENLLSVSSAVKEFGENLKYLFRYRDVVTGMEQISFEKPAAQLEELNSLLKEGIRGDAVKTLQERLMKLGYDVGPTGADGIFGPKTLEGLKKFQEDFGLTIDGIYGADSHKKMQEALGGSETEFQNVATYTTVFGDTLQKVHTIASAFFTVINFGTKVIGFLWDAFKIGASVLSPVREGIFEIIAAFSGWVAGLNESIDKSEVFTNWLSKLETFVQPIKQWFADATDSVLKFFGIGADETELGDTIGSASDKLKTFSDFWNKLKENIADLGIWEKLTGAFQTIREAFENAGISISEWWGKSKDAIGEKGSSFLTTAANGIATAIGKAADLFAKFSDWIAPFISNIPTYAATIRDFFVSIWDSISAFAAKTPGIWTDVKEFFSGIWDAIKGFFSGNGNDEVNEGATDEVKKPFEILSSIGDWIKTTWNDISTTFSNIFESIGKFLKWNAWWMITVGALAGIIALVVKIFKSISNFAENLAILKGKKVDEKAGNNIGNTLLKIAASIAIIGAAIYLLGKIDPDTLKQGAIVLGSIAAVLGLFTIAGALLAKKKLNKGLDSVAKSMTSLAIAIGVLTASIYLLGTMKTPVLIQGGLAVIALMGAMLLMVKMVGNAKISLKGFAALGTVIGIMATVVKKLGKMKTGQLVQGLAGLIAIMGMLSVFMIAIGKLGSGIDFSSISKTFIAIAASMFVLTMVVEKLGNMGTGTLIQGIGSLLAIMTALSVFMVLAGKFGQNGSMNLNIKGVAKAAAAIVAAIGIIVGGLILIVGSLGLIDSLSGGWVTEQLENGGRVIQALSDALTPFCSKLGIAIMGILTASQLLSALMKNGSVISALKGDLIAALLTTGIGIITGIATAAVTALGEIERNTNGEFSANIQRGGEILTTVVNALEPLFSKVGIAVATVMAASTAMGIAMGPYALIGGLVADGVALIFTAGLAFIFGIAVACVEGLGAWDESLNGGLIEKLKSGGDVLGQLGESLGSFLGGITSGQLKKIAEGLETISSEEIDEEKVNRTLDIVTRISDLANGVSSLGEVDFSLGAFSISKKSGFTVFCEDIKSLGTSISDFATSIENINENVEMDTDTTLIVCDKIATFLTDISGDKYNIDRKQNGVFTWFSGQNETDSLMTYMEKLGEVVTAFGKTSRFLSFTTIKSDTETLKSVVENLADLFTAVSSETFTIEKTKGAIVSWFSEDSETQSLISYIPSIGKAVSELHGKIEGLSDNNLEEDTKTVSNVIREMADLLTYISGDSVKLTNDTDLNTGGVTGKITELSNEIGAIGTAISSFDFETKNVDLDRFSSFATQFNAVLTSMAGVDTENIGVISGAIEQLRTLFSDEGDNAITTENFLKGLDIGKATEKLSTFTTGLGEAIGANTEIMAGYSQQFNQAGSDMISAISGGMGDNLDTSGVDRICGGILSAFKSYGKSFNDVGLNFSRGLAYGIQSGKAFAVAQAGAVARAAVAKVKEIFNSNSPSRVAIEIGEYFSEGLGIGIKQNADMAVQSSRNMATAVIDNARNGLSMLSSIIENNMDTDPVVRPVVDLSNVQSGARAINGMLSGRTTIRANASIEAAANAASSTARRKANQNGSSRAEKSVVTRSEDNSVNLTGNTFYVRSDNDIHALASEIASLTKQQQLGLGATY